jgi:UDP-N-acetylmuramate--alanine ligase
MPKGSIDVSLIILAAGLGKRMNSRTSKVLHQVGGKPMILHTWELAQKINPAQIIIVANTKNIRQLQKNISGNTQFIIQKEQKGTADAVAAALPQVLSNDVAVLYGDDTAFYEPKTLKGAYKKHLSSGSVITFVTLIKKDATGLGRIVRKNSKLVSIIEEKDASAAQKQIKEVNDGLYFFKKAWLITHLNRVKPSPVTGEYYLTDLIQIALNNNQKVETYTLKDMGEWHGVNTPADLKEANLKLERKIHIMGIAGAGAAAVAAIAKKQGYDVSGCDLNPSSVYLENLKGIEVERGHSPDHLHTIGKLLISGAILRNDPKNPELQTAKKNKIPVLLWEEFQSQYLQSGKFVIAVAGAYGKSTTTSMISKVLIDAGLDPTCEVGAKILDWGVNFRIGKSKYYVCEIDEYMDKFLNYSPDVLVVLNLGWDHPDYFKTREQLENSYKKLVQRVKPGGTLIIPANLNDLGKSAPKSVHVVKIDDFGKYNLSIIGDFRKENGDAALTVAKLLKLDLQKAKSSAENFSGTGRRLELKGTVGSVEVYDDYAVQPYTVLKTASALAEKFPKKRMAMVFEPHTFSRINKFFEDFVSSLKNINADHIYVTNVYPAREKGDVEKLSKKIVKAVGAKASYSGSIEQTAQILAGELGKYDIVLSMGAGNVYKIYDLLTSSS